MCKRLAQSVLDYEQEPDADVEEDNGKNIAGCDLVIWRGSWRSQRRFFFLATMKSCVSVEQVCPQSVAAKRELYGRGTGRREEEIKATVAHQTALASKAVIASHVGPGPGPEAIEDEW